MICFMSREDVMPPNDPSERPPLTARSVCV
jgi:hypothetical protein